VLIELLRVGPFLQSNYLDPSLTSARNSSGSGSSALISATHSGSSESESKDNRVLPSLRGVHSPHRVSRIAVKRESSKPSYTKSLCVKIAWADNLLLVKSLFDLLPSPQINGVDFKDASPDW
jgi:hypothetical protein